MLGQINQMFVTADLEYRRERIARDLRRLGRPSQRRWPISLTNPNRRRPGLAVRPQPSPHHAILH